MQKSNCDCQGHEYCEHCATVFFKPTKPLIFRIFRIRRKLRTLNRFLKPMRIQFGVRFRAFLYELFFSKHTCFFDETVMLTNRTNQLLERLAYLTKDSPEANKITQELFEKLLVHHCLNCSYHLVKTRN